MIITKEKFAELLHGNEYRDEITKEQEQLAKDNRLAIIFGASDDLCEIRGYYDDEIDCWGGGKVFPGVKAIWSPREKRGESWIYETEIPHATFDIMEDDEIYCQGIIIEV